MNEVSDTNATFLNESPWIQSQIVIKSYASNLFPVRETEPWHGYVERMTPYGPIKESVSLGEERLLGDRIASLVEAQQADPSVLIRIQGLVGGIVEAHNSWTSPAPKTKWFDFYSAARETATRVTAVEGLNLFLVTPGSPLRGLATGLSPQESKEMPDYSPSENWDEGNDQRFDFLVEKEALGELDEIELEELEQLSKKRDRTLARVSDEDWARERERSKALAELQDLLERYAPPLR
jgi:hypothetical protein